MNKALVRKVQNYNEPGAKPEIDEYVIKFRRHPIYDLYAGSRCGKYINVNRKLINNRRKTKNGFMR